ncbi:MAG: histidinol dehydrogenase [Phycisphaeraceae bacterium]|nr:histidinol dehydrogenase [Phycisphaeraceae bacterium]
MSQSLDSILFNFQDPDWSDKLDRIYEAAQAATYFEDGCSEDTALTGIIQQVRQHKNKALLEFSHRFDGVDLGEEQLRVEPEVLEAAHQQLQPALLESLRLAIGNVRQYQQAIFVGDKSSHPGIRYTPIDRVGVCVPGASAPLPSTVIMTVVPAQVAGVQDIAVISPPRYQGSIHPVILGVCHELGITEVYRMGGAHGVAALAYGTETIDPVHKIVGPGNQWVQMAKRKVFGRVDIDSIAGPSEVLILANDQADPAWIAADMLSQAEHAPGSAVVFTDSVGLAGSVLAELKDQVVRLDRSEETLDCLLRFSSIIAFDSIDHVVEQANLLATEHLEIQCGDQTQAVAARIKNAGAMFLGGYTPVAVGDYWAGPSHTLPTGRTARFFSALSSNDFIKSTSVISYDATELQNAASHIVALATTEGLDAHAKSVQIRFKNSHK